MADLADPSTYFSFLDSKRHLSGNFGFAPTFLPDALFDFQKHLVDWALRSGRSALFEDCGMGKSPQQLTWAQNVVERENKPVLVMTPLAVSSQTVREGEKFGIECRRSQDGHTWNGIVVTNYERLSMFDPNDFAGAVCDESSILKSFDGVRRQQITDFMRKMKYRLLCTATAAPNDYIELGTSSEALGYLGHMDMLNRFFKHDANTSDTKHSRGRFDKGEGDRPKWRFKGHSELPFWQWVCSWARAIRRPSDIGFDDGPFKLPPLTERTHIIESRTLPDGCLFPVPAVGLTAQRQERRRTLEERCESAAHIASQTEGASLIWCHLNDEGRVLQKLIPGSVEVSGSDADEAKEEAFLAFISGDIKKLVTKEKIAGWGLNFQHCSHIVRFPSHSFEGYYQGIRRCWRFGQKNPVTVDTVATEGERPILDNLARKSIAAEVMFSRLVEQMNHAVSIDSSRSFTQKEEIPSWL